MPAETVFYSGFIAALPIETKICGKFLKLSLFLEVVNNAVISSHSISRRQILVNLLTVTAGATLPFRTEAALFNNKSRQPATSQPPLSPVEALRLRCHEVARMGLHYRFGGDTPEEGGLDCSGSVQYVLKSLGLNNVPRTSYAQYNWLKSSGTLRTVGLFLPPDKAIRNLRPGDLVFWGKTYNSGHKVSHVMIYLGQNPQDGKRYVFGARSQKVKGVLGSEVDVFELRGTGHGKLIGYGQIPGLA